eukprot:Hpha_TRINITY_DN2884_c0_g1::TRINITY_DN2884_c0_g1_i1::g.171272::m.171272
MLSQIIMLRKSKDGGQSDLGQTEEFTPAIAPSSYTSKPRRRRRDQQRHQVREQDRGRGRENEQPPAGLVLTAPHKWENADCGGGEIRTPQSAAYSLRSFGAPRQPAPGRLLVEAAASQFDPPAGIGLSLPRKRPQGGAEGTHGRRQMFRPQEVGVSLVWPTPRKRPP